MTDFAIETLRLGFSSHSHFTAAFQKVYGRTPSEPRQGVPGR
jgi:AraC-like DNA-binding protein